MLALITAVLLAQDKAAEETLSKIEQSLLAAKTLSVEFRSAVRIQFDDHEEKTLLSGRFLSKEGNRTRMELKLVKQGGESNTLHVSDGTKVADSRAEERVETPKDYTRNFIVAALSRTGITEAYLTTFSASKPEDYDVRKKFALSKVRVDADDGELKSLSYTMAFGEHEKTVRLWYHPTSFRPVKRTLINKLPNATLTTTESYENYAVDAAIPDERFALPAEK